MQLKLTWKINNSEIDLMVHSEQKIVDTMKVMAERGYIDDDTIARTIYVKSERNKENINVKLSYDDGRIYSGDVLSLVENK